MHIIVALVTLVGVLAVWYWRVKMAREAGGEMLDAANDVRLAARRLMYKRKHDVHPTDAVDDPRLAASGIVVAVATMDNPISQAEIATLTQSCQETFDVTEREALDIVSFGRWIAGQCTTNGEAVRRLSKVVNATAGIEAGPDLIAMIEKVATADGSPLGSDETDAIDTVRRALGMG
jgi:uncharacterized tellurite resistance protein B-like protein